MQFTTCDLLIAGVGGKAAGGLFLFQDLVESLQQRQSLVLKQTYNLLLSPSTALAQTIFFVPEAAAQNYLNNQGGDNTDYRPKTILTTIYLNTNQVPLSLMSYGGLKHSINKYIIKY